MQDAYLDTFAERLVECEPLTVRIINREALQCFLCIRKGTRAPLATELVGLQTSSHASGLKGMYHQYGVTFFFNPQDLGGTLDSFSTQYIFPAMSWLASLLPANPIWAEPSLELPGGAAKDIYGGIEMRAIIYRDVCRDFNVPLDWVKLDKFYDIATDVVLDAVLVGQRLRFDIRTKIFPPLGLAS